MSFVQSQRGTRLTGCVHSGCFNDDTVMYRLTASRSTEACTESAISALAPTHTLSHSKHSSSSLLSSSSTGGFDRAKSSDAQYASVLTSLSRWSEPRLKLGEVRQHLSDESPFRNSSVQHQSTLSSPDEIRASPVIKINDHYVSPSPTHRSKKSALSPLVSISQRNTPKTSMDSSLAADVGDTEDLVEYEISSSSSSRPAAAAPLPTKKPSHSTVRASASLRLFDRLSSEPERGRTQGHTSAHGEISRSDSLNRARTTPIDGPPTRHSPQRHSPDTKYAPTARSPSTAVPLLQTREVPTDAFIVTRTRSRSDASNRKEMLELPVPEVHRQQSYHTHETRI